MVTVNILQTSLVSTAAPPPRQGTCSQPACSQLVSSRPDRGSSRLSAVRRRQPAVNSQQSAVGNQQAAGSSMLQLALGFSLVSSHWCLAGSNFAHLSCTSRLSTASRCRPHSHQGFPEARLHEAISAKRCRKPRHFEPQKATQFNWTLCAPLVRNRTGRCEEMWC